MFEINVEKIFLNRKFNCIAEQKLVIREKYFNILKDLKENYL